MSRIVFAIIAALAGLVDAASMELPPSHACVRILGRSLAVDAATVQWAWSGSGALVAFEGTACSIHLQARGGIFRVLVDGMERAPLDLSSNSDTLFELALGLPARSHVVEIRQRTEAQYSTARFRGFRIDGTPGTLPEPSPRRIEFYGNSITCGYGILDSVKEHGFTIQTEDEGLSYAAKAADTLGADRRAVCWSGKGVVQNYGRDTVNPTIPMLHRQILAGDTQHLWDFSQWIPQAVVVNLGTNDFSTVAPDSTKFHRTYLAFVDTLHARYPSARFVLVDGPMLSDGYPAGVNALTTLRRHLDNLVVALKAQGTEASHLSLSPQTGALGYGADWHPSRAQAASNSRELTAHLEKVMEWSISTRRSRAPSSSRTELLRGPSGSVIQAPANADIQARLVDLQGHIRWNGLVPAGTSAVLPGSSSLQWVQWSSEGLSGTLGLAANLR